MAMPMMMGMAASAVIAPVMDRACKMPTAAEALWSTAVKRAPTRMPRSGLSKRSSSSRNLALSFRGSTASDMALMPNMSTAKPSRMSPTCFLAVDLAVMRKIVPTMATAAVMVAVENRDTQPPPPPMRDRHSSQPVTLVPTLAPRMMGMAWMPFIMPEFTKPTTMMVVAAELWMAAVTPRPSSAPLMGVLLSRQRMTSSLFPATRLSPSPMTDMPNRNSATPHSRESTLLMPIDYPYPVFLLKKQYTPTPRFFVRYF